MCASRFQKNCEMTHSKTATKNNIRAPVILSATPRAKARPRPAGPRRNLSALPGMCAEATPLPFVVGEIMTYMIFHHR